MATYTVQVRTLVENHFDLGLKEYPIFDEAYREGLNEKIIKHFYFREIGFETAGLFKFYLNQRMLEIMPYYNQLYKSELIEFDPLKNVDYETKSDNVRNSTAQSIGSTETDSTSETENANNQKSANAGSSSQSVAANNKAVHSDTPQGLLEINSIENEVYASTADYDTQVNNTTSNDQNVNTLEGTNTGTNTSNSKTNSADTTTMNNTDNYFLHKLGKEGFETYSEMLNKFRGTFLNIDMMIINDLKDLFMNIY